MRIVAVVCIVAGLFLMGWLIEPPLNRWINGTGIDCGPEGKPVLNGTACIDKEPATYP